MSARVRKGHIGVRLPREMEWYRSRSVRKAIEVRVSRKKKADTLPGTGKCSPESGRASLESAGIAVMSSVNLDGRACPSLKVGNIQ